jgi:hypothetical protein
MKRSGSAAWSGNLRDDKGLVSTESHALDTSSLHPLQPLR